MVDAYYGGALVAEAADLAITGGSVTDTSKPGVRRQVDVDLLPVPGLYDKLAPTGTQLRVRSVWRYPDGTTETVPMGLFEVDSVTRDYGPDGSLKVTGSDKWVKIQRRRFLLPETSTTGVYIHEQIATLIRRTLGNSEPVDDRSVDAQKTGSWYWEQDADATINQLAEVIGARVFFDRDGLATIADIPAGDTPAVWTVDASNSGVLLSASRSVDRSRTYNVVVVTGEATDGTAPFPPAIVWDHEPTSPTYAGTDPQSDPGSAGPFGVVPYFYSSPLLTNVDDALQAGATILRRTVGLNSQLTLTQVTNHALDVLDVIDVLLPRERYDQPPTVEHHLIDKITHPLTPDGTQTIETRATRTDAL